MALARDQIPSSSTFYDNFLQSSSSSPPQFDHSICPNYGFDNYNSPKMITNNSNQEVIMSQSSPISSSNSGQSSNNGFSIIPENNYNYQTHLHDIETPSSIDHYKTAYDLTTLIHSDTSSFLSFQHDQHDPKNISQTLLLEEVDCNGGYQDQWRNYFDASVDRDHQDQFGARRTCLGKRPHLEENMQTLKKQCRTSSSKSAAKPKSSSTSKDPQSLAAKNRRERISERLKVLQDLVPNGSKVDLVTMLEKAIGYVKFLQLQVKVLAADEFWPAAGGKAPIFLKLGKPLT